MKSFVAGEGSEFLHQILLKRRLPLLILPGEGKKNNAKLLYFSPSLGEMSRSDRGGQNYGKCIFATFPALFQAFPRELLKS